MEENRSINLTGLDIDDAIAEIRRILQDGDNSHIQLNVVKKKNEVAKDSCISYTLTLFDFEETKSRVHNKPLMSSLIRGSTAESMRHMFKMSSRMNSYVARHMQSESRLLMRQDTDGSTRSHFQLQLNKGMLLYAEKEYILAIEQFRSMESGNLSEQQKACLNLSIGNCYFRSKKYEQAIEIYTKQHPLQPERSKGQRLNNLASCYAKLKRYELSLKAYNEALKIYSKYEDVDCSNLLNNVGIIYMLVKMYKSAQRYFSKAIDERKNKSPASVDLLSFSYTKLALCQIEEGKYEQAIQNLLVALNWAEMLWTERGQGDLEEVLKGLATCCEKLKRWSQALEYYERLSNTSRNQGLILEKVCLIHRQLGHQPEFHKFLRQAQAEYKRAGDERKVSQLNNIARVNGLEEVLLHAD